MPEGKKQRPEASKPARQWHLIDADGRVLGRIASVAARLLQGKHRAAWTPYLDGGDHVIVINAARVKLTGKKEDQKICSTQRLRRWAARERCGSCGRNSPRASSKKPCADAAEAKLGNQMSRKLKVCAHRSSACGAAAAGLEVA
jgi:large subunit ribosomal protein L13